MDVPNVIRTCFESLKLKICHLCLNFILQLSTRIIFQFELCLQFSYICCLAQDLRRQLLNRLLLRLVGAFELVDFINSEDGESAVEEEHLCEPLDAFNESNSFSQIRDFRETFAPNQRTVHFGFEPVAHLAESHEKLVAWPCVVDRFEFTDEKPVYWSQKQPRCCDECFDEGYRHKLLIKWINCPLFSESSKRSSKSSIFK